MEHPAPAERWARFATGDLGLAEAWIAANLARISITSAGDRRFTFSAISAPVGDAVVARIHNSMVASCGYTPEDTVFACRSRSGRYVARPPGQCYDVAPGDVFVTYAEHGFDFSFDDVDFDVVSIPTATLHAAATDVLGYDPGRILFTTMAPSSDVAKRHWLATLAYTYRTVMDNPAALDNPLVAAAMTRNIATSILAAFPNTTTKLFHDGRDTALPSTLRRAVTFIEANAEHDMTLADIAAAARVSPRAVQAAFRSRLRTTPMSYVRRVRLAGAHGDLLKADPSTGATVAAIAARWGFPDAGHFTVVYRLAYGEPPSRTLRR